MYSFDCHILFHEYVIATTVQRYWWLNCALQFLYSTSVHLTDRLTGKRFNWWEYQRITVHSTYSVCSSRNNLRATHIFSNISTEWNDSIFHCDFSLLYMRKISGRIITLVNSEFVHGRHYPFVKFKLFRWTQKPPPKKKFMMWVFWKVDLKYFRNCPESDSKKLLITFLVSAR